MLSLAPFKKDKTKISLRLSLVIAIISIIAMLKEPVWDIYQSNYRYMPKPVGYKKIDLPEPGYQILNQNLPYRFKYSKHAQIESSQTARRNKYCINIVYPMFNAVIYLSYRAVLGDTKLLEHICHQAQEAALQHKEFGKASLVRAYDIKTRRGYSATIIELEGQVPTTCQFYITDNKDHFLRGAFYLNACPNNDFYEPIITYIKRDIMLMIDSLEWADLNGG